jgi:hypothetical protein
MGAGRDKGRRRRPGKAKVSFEPGIAGDLQAICAALALWRCEEAEAPPLGKLYAALEEEAARLSFDWMCGPPKEGWRVAVVVEHAAWGLGSAEPPERWMIGMLSPNRLKRHK